VVNKTRLPGDEHYDVEMAGAQTDEMQKANNFRKDS